ncbi:SMOOTHELIN-LIKE PROTEIN 1 [Salix koriyanagi]|uniref:SMOOTHELIN-LIKE PROTEIN 1 n=1 Tax=Salix koriyanagi TaxID=2511006 RepID=A0A9Q0WDN3_9ROSI|nr:SMOOTHELIN-LIKE PROTEIN 1 [Salix koriyanagi]
MEEAAGPEARQMFPVKESEHGSETGNGLRMHPATTIGEDDNSTDGRVLSSSSSSCSSSSGDPFELDADEISKPCAGDIGVPKHSENAQAPLEDYHNEIPVSSVPWQEQPPSHAHTLISDDGSAAQFPPTQVMERTADSNPSAACRIPSSVFARTKSNTPMEWSVASNESVFSIYMGTMSFTRDHQNWLGKSGELGFPGDCTSDSTPLIDYSSNQPPGNQHPVNKSTEVGPKISNVNEHLGGETDRPKAAETMRGVAKEDEEDGNKERSLAKGSLHSASPSLLSDASGESVKSFAFPILTGDDKSYSLSHKQYPSSRPQTPRSAQSSRVQQESKRLSEPEPEPEPEPVPKENLNVAPGKWFSCVPCCSFCS